MVGGAGTAEDSAMKPVAATATVPVELPPEEQSASRQSTKSEPVSAS